MKPSFPISHLCTPFKHAEEEAFLKPSAQLSCLHCGHTFPGPSCSLHLSWFAQVQGTASSLTPVMRGAGGTLGQPASSLQHSYPGLIYCSVSWLHTHWCLECYFWCTKAQAHPTATSPPSAVTQPGTQNGGRPSANAEPSQAVSHTGTYLSSPFASSCHIPATQVAQAPCLLQLSRSTGLLFLWLRPHSGQPPRMRLGDPPSSGSHSSPQQYGLSTALCVFAAEDTAMWP